MIGGCFQILDFVIAQRAITKSKIERVQAQPAACAYALVAAPRVVEKLRTNPQ